MKEIQLSRGKVALVDDEDYDWLMETKWSAIRSPRNFYAQGKPICFNSISMHRYLMTTERLPGYSPTYTPLPEGMEVDHIDGNGLNNQKSNLRVVTHSQNLLNSRIFYKNEQEVVERFISGLYRIGKLKHQVSKYEKKLKELGHTEVDIEGYKEEARRKLVI